MQSIVRKLKNNKAGDSDGIVDELLTYSESGMVDLLEQLFSVIWQEEIVPSQWRDGFIVIFLRKGIERILVNIGISPY